MLHPTIPPRRLMATRRRCLGLLAASAGLTILSACGGGTASAPNSVSVSGTASAASVTGGAGVAISGTASRAKTGATTTSAASATSVATATAAATSAPAGTAATLTFIHFQDTPQELQLTVYGPVKQFEQGNPGSHVSVVIAPTGPAYIEKLLTMIAGGVPPDLMALGGPAAGLPIFASKGILTDLSPLISRDSKEVQPKDFYPEALAVGQWNGKQYGLITSPLSTAVLVYNADALQKVGVQQTPAQLYDAGKWTWDTFTAIAHQATVRTSSSAPPSQYGFLVPFDIQQGSSFIWEAGGDLLDGAHTKCLLDSPESIAGFQYLYDLQNKYQVSPTPATLTSESGQALFTSGRLCMGINWAHEVEFQDGAAKFTWDIAPLPTGKAGELVNDNFNNIALAQSSKWQTAGWDFIKRMTSPATYLSKQHTAVPPRPSVYNDWLRWMQQLPRPKNLQYLSALSAHSRSLPYIPVWQQINVAWPKETSYLADGSRSPTNIAKALTTIIDGILQQSAP